LIHSISTHNISKTRTVPSKTSHLREKKRQVGKTTIPLYSYIKSAVHFRIDKKGAHRSSVHFIEQA
jgi:hypothetical protein